MSRQEAHVRIDASPREVWQVLVDIDRYPQWNRDAQSDGLVDALRQRQQLAHVEQERAVAA